MRLASGVPHALIEGEGDATSFNRRERDKSRARKKAHPRFQEQGR